MFAAWWLGQACFSTSDNSPIAVQNKLSHCPKKPKQVYGIKSTMSRIPLKPGDCNIEEIHSFDGCLYRWKLPQTGNFRLFVLPFLICFLGFALFGCVLESVQLTKIARNDEAFAFRILFHLIGMSICSIVGLFLACCLYLMLRPARPEMIKLTDSDFHYDPGRLAFANPQLIYAPEWVGLYDPLRQRRKCVTIPKSQLGPLVLDRFGGRQRLYFKSGADRIEIGEHLRESEREWLAANIQSWIAR